MTGTSFFPLTLLAHPDYSETNAFMYEACLHIQASKASVLVYDKISREPRLLKVYPAAVESLNQSEILLLNETLNLIPELNLKLSRVHVLAEHPRHSLVPEVFFDKDQLETYFTSGNEKLDLEDLQSYRMPQFDGVMVFPFHRYVASLLNSKLKSPRIIHHSIALLYGINQLLPAGDNLILYYTPAMSTIVYTKNKSVQFINSFVAETENDALYFLLATIEEFGLTANSPIWLAGDVNEEDTLFNLLKKYLNQVNWMPGRYGIKEEHRYFTLLSSLLCE